MSAAAEHHLTTAEREGPSVDDVAAPEPEPEPEPEPAFPWDDDDDGGPVMDRGQGFGADEDFGFDPFLIDRDG